MGIAFFRKEEKQTWVTLQKVDSFSRQHWHGGDAPFISLMVQADEVIGDACLPELFFQGAILDVDDLTVAVVWESNGVRIVL